MDAVVVLDSPGDATAADGDATAVWVSAEGAPCGGEKGTSCSSYVVQAAGYDPLGLPEVEVEVPPTGEVGEPVEILAPTEEVFAHPSSTLVTEKPLPPRKRRTPTTNRAVTKSPSPAQRFSVTGPA